MCATLKEIAKRAGCSPATVSRVLNQSGTVASGLVEQIRAARFALGDDAVSKACRRGRPRGATSLSRVIDIALFRNEGIESISNTAGGLVIGPVEEKYPEILNSPRLQLSTDFYRSILDGVSGHLAQTGMLFKLRICHDVFDERLVSYLNNSRHRGLLLMGSPDPRAAEFIRQCTLPIVLIDVLGVASAPVVLSDNEGGIRMALEHLIALGHRRIGFAGNIANPSFSRRYHAFSGGMAIAGFPVRKGSCFFEAGSIRRIADRFVEVLSVAARPSAIVCANDCYALGVLQAAARIGLCVPRDLSVTGFDDITAAALSTPPLTTVRVPLQQLGACAADTLLRTSASPESAWQWNNSEIVCRTELVVRGSTAVCRIPH